MTYGNNNNSRVNLLKCWHKIPSQEIKEKYTGSSVLETRKCDIVMEISVPLGVRKGAWTEEEDELLRKCIQKHGVGKWHQVPSRAGLNRCRKSCRLRWLNYLRPNIKRGNFTPDEIDLIIRLHKLLGNRWSLIAGRLCGRTSNDIKNYWNTHLQKKHACQKDDTHKLKVEKKMETTIFRPQPRPFNNFNLVSKVKYTESDNSVPIENASSNPSSVSALAEPEKSWWDYMNLDFESNNYKNRFPLPIEVSIEKPIEDNWIDGEVGTSMFEIGDISIEDDQLVSDWANIFSKTVDVGDLFNDNQI